MALRKLTLLLCLFLTPLLAKEDISKKTVYVYGKEVQGKFYKTKWTLEETNEAVRIVGESSRGETVVISTPYMDTQSFSHQSKIDPNEYSIFRDGDYIVARSNQGGEVRQKEFKIGNRSWVQEFDFTFRPFILSSADTYKFSIVHPRKLSMHSLIATKVKSEEIRVGDEYYQTTKVKVTLTGLKKLFWKAELWFERETGDLIKYVANEGPNTPTSTITLLSKTSG